MPVGSLREFTKESHRRLEMRHPGKTKEASWHRIMTGGFALCETIGPAPDRRRQLGDELFGTMALLPLLGDDFFARPYQA